MIDKCIWPVSEGTVVVFHTGACKSAKAKIGASCADVNETPFEETSTVTTTTVTATTTTTTATTTTTSNTIIQALGGSIDGVAELLEEQILKTDAHVAALTEEMQALKDANAKQADQIEQLVATLSKVGSGIGVGAAGTACTK